MYLVKNRDIVRNIFIIFLIVFFAVLYIKQGNSLIFPGLEEKIGWIVLITGILTVALYTPYKKILKKKIKRKKIDIKEIQEEGIKKTFNMIFQILLVIFLLFFLIQQFDSKLVEGFFDINYLLVAVIIFGVIAILLEPKEKKSEKEEKAGKKYHIFAVLLGFVGAGIIWLKIFELGWLGAVISILIGIVIIMISIIIQKENEDSGS